MEHRTAQHSGKMGGGNKVEDTKETPFQQWLPNEARRF